VIVALLTPGHIFWFTEMNHDPVSFGDKVKK
jgi:hypothetical protein